MSEEASPASGVTAKRLRPIEGHWVLCSTRACLVENVMDYKCIHHTMHILTAKESRENGTAEAIGVLVDTYDTATCVVNADSYPGIAPEKKNMTVLFKPLGGILNQSEIPPIRYAPITIDLELVSDEKAPVISIGGPAAISFKAENTSTNWSIINVQAKRHLCTLDDDLDKSHAQHVLPGDSSLISYNTFA